ncbi:MAG: hypothetical protein U9O94_04180 [Nanoarchaeota archaeon]|nr:hypothetical protein [Nanoarchaeota archaeon]
MAIWKKIDVQGDVQPILWKCFGYIAQELAKNGVHNIYITSIREGLHSLTSFHYIGLAIDWQQSGIENEKSIIEKGIYRFCNKYRKSVNDFDLIMYTDSRNIFHLEYDVKN